VTYLFMAVHYPLPGRRDDVYRRMLAMASGAAHAEGLLEIGPWREYDGDRVVGFSRWESRHAFEAAMPGSGMPNDIVHDGECRSRTYFHLVDQAGAGRHRGRGTEVPHGTAD
jgi:hypothetical protein